VPLKELRTNTLDKLDLSGNGPGVPEALVLAKLVEGSAVLTNLNLWANSIGDEGAKALAAALRVNGVLKTLNLNFNKIGVEGAKAIGKALEVNGVLIEKHRPLRQQFGRRGEGSDSRCGERAGRVQAQDVSGL